MGLPATANIGRYELLSELGRGGMAELFVGRLKGLGGFAKVVAIKRILPHLSQDTKFVDLFLNEGRIASRLSHPNLCQVFELGEDEGQLYLAMEYLEGVTWEVLARALPEDPQLVLRAVTGVMAQACEGLHYAHELRDGGGSPSPVIHRDISPQNLFVTVDGVCKILDFGVAKMVTELTNTRSGVLKGKLPYMSPEQIRGERLDGRSDTFALGVVVWEALARRELFMRDTEFHIWKAILEDAIPAVSAHAASYGHDVDGVVMRALERERDDRHASIRDFGTALRALAASCGGAMSTLELGELVRTRCHESIAARARKISGLTAQRTPVAVPAELPARAATTRVELRDDSHVLGARQRRRWPAITAALTAVAGIAIAVVVTRGETAPATGPKVEQRPPHAASVVPADAASIDPPVAAPELAASVAGSSATPAPPPRSLPRPKPATRAPAPRPAAKDKRPAGSIAPATTSDVAVASASPGTLSVDVRPSARVYIDGAFVDETPLYRHSLSAGPHELRVVRPDGAERVRTIRIEPGKPLNLGTLQW